MKYHKQQSGLTIVEVLVTLGILSLVLTAVSGSILSSFDVAKTAQNSFIASGLAQEGMEIVRNIRDNGFVAGSDLSVLPNGNFRVQWNDQSISQTAGAIDGEPELRRDDNGLMSYGGAKGSGFRRVITITGNNNEKNIVVTVGWTERGRNKALTAETVLYNWR